MNLTSLVTLCPGFQKRLIQENYFQFKKNLIKPLQTTIGGRSRPKKFYL